MHVTPYRPGGLRAQGAQVGIAVFCALYLAIDFIPDSGDPEEVGVAALLVAVGMMGAFLLSAVCFLMWMHNAHKNLAALGTAHTQFTPGWAVGGWFVPFLNLVRPFQVAREIWDGSDPDALTSRGPQAAGTSGLLMGWWVLWIGSNFASNFLNGAAEMGEGAYLGAMVIDNALNIASGVTAILVVRAIEQRQAERHAILQRGTSTELRDALGHASEAPPV